MLEMASASLDSFIESQLTDDQSDVSSFPVDTTNREWPEANQIIPRDNLSVKRKLTFLALKIKGVYIQ